MSKSEILAPAGNMERLKWDVAYGADAVYFGITEFSLRAHAANFTLDEANEALTYLHDHGKRGYVTLNIYPFSDEYDGLMNTAEALDDMNADAFIVSDIGVMREMKNRGLKTPVHVSTQANTTSYQAVLAYRDLGAKRVNLARELSCEQIEYIQKNLTGKNVETEVFIHGSVCFSYSGRCAISDYMTGRRANRGDCTHPCRWQYSLMEEKRPGEYYPVFEDARGLYIFNCKDLALFEFLPKLRDMGVASFKIEGRMKTVHYTATVLSLYRAVMDGKELAPEYIWEQLSRVHNHGYSLGFMKGDINSDDYCSEPEEVKTSSTLIATVGEAMQGDMRLCSIKNSIYAGETLEMLTPSGLRIITVPDEILAADGRRLSTANNQDEILVGLDIPPYSVLRRVKK